MSKQILHITNGSSLTSYLTELGIKGEFFTWHEMLCEGPTIEQIDTHEFVEVRKSFLNKYYDIDIDEYAFHKELELLDNTKNYYEINLWFEYDLFCHINLIAVISLLIQKRNKLPLYLICSGRIKGSTDFKGLAELNETQLLNHYKKKIKLNNEDIDSACELWNIYCSDNHNLFKPYVTKKSSFIYLSSCLKAHLKRFPDSQNGLCRIERHILEIVKENQIKSTHHLLGYVLNYQGYYGYGDIQIKKMISKLDLFFSKTENRLELNRKGHEALLNQHNFSSEINNDIQFGGVNRLQYQFNKKQNKLVKTIYNAN
ncbi:MAG: DUF1835 domain-containing protein [Flavobacteriaceae bacterium]